MYLLDSKLIARLVLIRRITDKAGEATDEEGYIVTEFLKLAQLTHGNGVTEMQISRAGIVSAVNTQHTPVFFGSGEARVKFFTHGFFGTWITVFGTGHENVNLLINRGHSIS